MAWCELDFPFAVVVIGTVVFRVRLADNTVRKLSYTASLCRKSLNREGSKCLP